MGGGVVANGTPTQIIEQAGSLTGPYIPVQKHIAARFEPRATNGKAVTVVGAKANNLRSVDVTFPLGVITVVTGVSGSGKSTLVNDILYKALAKARYRSREEAGAHKA